MEVVHSAGCEGRPYRSHLHPACLSCKKRKSRCKTRDASEKCIMCQVHDTQCKFPEADSGRTAAFSSRRVSSRRKQARPSRSGHSLEHRNTQSPLAPVLDAPRAHRASNNDRTDALSSSGNKQQELSNLMGIVSETGDNSSHIVSPAIADDNDVLESYLSTFPDTRRRCIIQTNPSSNRPLRPVLFNTVPRRPLGVTANQSLAAMKCEIIEKYLEPYVQEVVDMWVLYISHFPLSTNNE